MSEQAFTGKESEPLVELVARVRRSGCDTRDLDRLLNACAEFARQRTAEKVRKRAWRLSSKRADAERLQDAKRQRQRRAEAQGPTNA